MEEMGAASTPLVVVPDPRVAAVVWAVAPAVAAMVALAVVAAVVATAVAAMVEGAVVMGVGADGTTRDVSA